MSEKFSRRSFLRTTALGSAGLLLARQIAAQPARLARKPNLIVFLPDQQRADTIACYGGNPILAPNLNKLSSQSFVFQNTYVTQPVCTPSRSSLLTGTWPHANGCTRNNVRLADNVRCFPELLDDSDYVCAYMGKWHLGDEVQAQRGFSDWVSIMDGHVSRRSKNPYPAAPSDYDKFLLSEDLQPDIAGQGSFSRGFGSRLPIELSKPKFLEARACEFLEQHRRDPFVLFVAFYEPHPPYNGPLNHEHPLDQIRLDPTADHIFGSDAPLRYRLRQEWDQQRFSTSSEKHLRIKQRYLGLVTEIDQTIGAVLSTLEKLELADSTIVVHTSDHGDMMGAHGMFGKQLLFQEAVRVPYLVRMPEQRSTASIPRRMSHIDFTPTLLGLLGRETHPQCAGKNCASLVQGESIPEETIFMQWNPSPKRAVKKHTRLAGKSDIQRAIQESTRVALSADGWKLCLRDADKNELYHLPSDPGERQNLFGRRDLGNIIGRLTGEIHAWQERVGDNIKV